MKTSIALAAGIAEVLIAAAAPATTLHFSYASTNGSNGYASWDQSSTPVVITSSLGSFTDVAVTNGFELISTYSDTFTDVYFYSSSNSLGYTFGANGDINIGDVGPQIYTGSETAPVFSSGSYVQGDLGRADGTLTITGGSAVPEPGTWSMMLLGVAGLGGALRARRPRRFVAA